MSRGLLLLLFIFFISACSSNSLTLDGTYKEPIQVNKELYDIWNEIPHYGQEIAKKHSIKILQGITGFSHDAIFLEVRRFGDFEKPLTEEEKELFKKSFFEYAGQVYNLKLIELTCCEQEANFIGEILEIDNEINALKIKNSENQRMDWVNLSKDAKIVSEQEQQIEFSELKVGQKVKAWSLKYLDEQDYKEVVKVKVLSK